MLQRTTIIKNNAKSNIVGTIVRIMHRQEYLFGMSLEVDMHVPPPLDFGNALSKPLPRQH